MVFLALLTLILIYPYFYSAPFSHLDRIYNYRLEWTRHLQIRFPFAALYSKSSRFGAMFEEAFIVQPLIGSQLGLLPQLLPFLIGLSVFSVKSLRARSYDTRTVSLRLLIWIAVTFLRIGWVVSVRFGNSYCLLFCPSPLGTAIGLVETARFLARVLVPRWNEWAMTGRLGSN